MSPAAVPTTLKGIKLKKPRPKSRAEKVATRQRRLLVFNHPDLLEERQKRRSNFNELLDGDTNFGRKKKRKNAKEKTEELFRDLEGKEEDEEHDDTAMMEDEEDDEELDDEAISEDGMEEEEENPEHEGRDEQLEGPDEEHTDEEEEFSDDDAPPEEFSSVKKPAVGEKSAIGSTKSEVANDDRQKQARKKLSKKKRDSNKKKRVQRVQEGVYKVEVGTARFDVVALGDDGAKDDEDEGALLRRPPIFSASEQQANMVSFRDQLMRLSTKKGRKAKQPRRWR